MTKKRAELPLAASVVTERLKQGGELHGRRILEVENYYVRSERGDKWQAVRHASIDTPIHVTGEVAMVTVLNGPPAKTPQDAARRMWTFVRQYVDEQRVVRKGHPRGWLVDDDLPETLRIGVNLMAFERALAIYDALARSRIAAIDAATFMANYGHLTAGQPRTAVAFERPMVPSEGPSRRGSVALARRGADVQWRIYRGAESLGIFEAKDKPDALLLAQRAGVIGLEERGLRVEPA